MDAAALVALQTYDLQHFQHLGANLLLRQLFQPQTERHILKHIQMREQGVFLEHRIHRTLVRRQVGNILAIKKDIAGLRRDKTGNHTQSRCFSAPGRSQKGNKLFVVNVQRKPVKDLLPVKLYNNVFQRYDTIFIHFYCIPLCGISSRTPAKGARRVSAYYAAPQRFVTRKVRCSSTYNTNVSRQRYLPPDAHIHIHYKGWEMFVNRI